MYRLIRSILFKIDPERVHHWVTGLLRTFRGLPGKGSFLSSKINTAPGLQRQVLGLTFKNPVGLAAGFDKNATLITEMSSLGFGFIEVGTVTPLRQAGNPKPRMFRLPADEALINRMGFNNDGVEAVAERIADYRKSVISKNQGIVIGGNIGKNKTTPNENAVDDYIKCFDRLFNVVDYFVVNVSSPNTPGLRALQEKAPLLHILNSLQQRNHQNGLNRPILLKIAPDLTDEQLNDIVEIVQQSGIAGVIATNTTINREGLRSPENLTGETGGLSGKPLTQRSTAVIRYLHQKSGGAFPIIGVGGIHSADDAIEKLEAGALLVQLYTGFIYEGPALISRINNKILAAHKYLIDIYH